MSRRLWVLSPLLLPAFSSAQFGQITEGVTIRVPGNPRTVVRLDPIEYEIVTGTWKNPQEGDEVGGQKWQKVRANAAGAIPTAGYFFASVESDKDQTAMLTALGNSLVYVNGELRAGDPYATGQFSFPIQLKRGVNTFLFLGGRGGLRATLSPNPGEAFLTLNDATLPDVRPNWRNPMTAGLVLTNPSQEPVAGLRVIARAGSAEVVSRIPSVLPMTLRKVPIQIPAQRDGKVQLTLMRGNRELQKLDLSLTVRKANEPYRVTFVSQIDGSVQYYAVNPSLRAGAGQALFLSLHGASVEAIGQAQAYSNKGWGHLVAPTNRRPFGFDWEDIGRLDALEVLDLAQKQLLTDRSRTYLTGHSMGGHGTWNLGVLFPGLFAAIAPSAGWESFESYGGGERFENPSGAALAISRSNAPSRTLDFVRNLKGLGIYVLHGDADTNVPVTEARKMVSALKEFHSDFQVHEEKGADHWWDKNPEPGADAVDWAPFFSLFSRRRIAPSREVLAVDFRTPHPGVSASRDWVTIHQQVTPFVPSHVSITCSPLLRRFEGYTENVATLEIWPDPLTQGGNWTVVLDGGNPITVTQTDKPVFLRRRPEGWQATEAPGKLEKGPHRNGGFKDVFRNRVVFVIGTKTEEAATWAEAKARYDAETFLVRGNGSVDIVTDREFNPRAFRDRNILLYGGPEINSAYDKVVDRSELKSQVSNNVASFFILPRKDSAVASVGVINGSSMVGLRLAERVPLFGSGAGMPDYLVIEPKMLLERYSGVIGAGFFDNSWR